MRRRALAATAAALLTSCADDVSECVGVCGGDNPLFAAATMTFETEVSPGVAGGFDLDGVDGPSRPDCTAQDFVAPDGTRGVDNQLARLMPLLFQAIGSAFPTLIQNAINDGGLSMLYEVVPPSEEGGRPALAFHRATGAPLLDTEGLVLSGQTFAVKKAPPFAVCRDAAVEGRTIRCGPFDFPLALVVFGVLYELTFRDAVVAVTLDEAGERAEMAVGGSVRLRDIFAITDNIEDGPKNLPDLVHTVLPPLADIIDRETEECDRISGAARLSFRTAFAQP